MQRTMRYCVLAAASLAGCSSQDQATEADYDDVAQALTAMVTTDNGGGEVGAMSDSVNIALGAGDLSIQASAAGHWKSSHLGLQYDYAISCKDEAGAAMQKCSRDTDSADVKVAWSGDLGLPHLTASVDRNGSWQLQKIQSGTAQLNGDSDFDLDVKLESLFRDVTRSYHVGYNAKYSDVTLDLAAKRIQSGSVRYSIDAERKATGPRRESEAEFSMDGELTFAADGTATLTLDRNFNYKLDTATGVMVKE
jgi:hypothetical protein